MDGNEIKEKINFNNKIIESQPLNIFVLNKEVKKAMEENKHLRAICDHKYNANGICIYCGSSWEEL